MYSKILILASLLIFLSPISTHAATIERCGDVGGQTWTSDNVYLITCDVTVSSGSTLTIQAGTVIKFESPSDEMVVYGTLDVQGTCTNRVVFTSKHDNTVGGTLPGSTGSPGYQDWGGISYYNGSNTFDNSIVRYGGYYYDGAIRVYNGESPTITGNIISGNYIGIEIENGSPVISGNSIEENLTGVRILNGNPTIPG